ncbi:MAG: hypothetical protein ABSH19_05570 [Opitutales bacterium]|jgi:hypothetical protein
MATLLKLQLAEGFREVAARKCERRLAWEEDGVLRLAETDFASPLALGGIGGVDCPVAMDGANGRGWAYCCQFRLGARDFSEIREFNLATGQSRRLVRLGLHQWALWLLAHWAEQEVLLALVATDTRSAAIHIRHHLALIETRTGAMRLVALPRDAFVPLASCARRRWLIFHGAEGTHLVSFSGRRLLTLPAVRAANAFGPRGRGASIHPQKPLALLGGDGVWLWNLETGALRQLRDRGQYPVWGPDGKGCWFSESSSDLFEMDTETGAERRLLRVAGNPYLEINYARPVAANADGTLLTLPLTRLLKVDPLAAGQMPTLARLHRLCVVDLTAREAWMAPGYARNLAWV